MSRLDRIFFFFPSLVLKQLPTRHIQIPSHILIRRIFLDYDGLHDNIAPILCLRDGVFVHVYSFSNRHFCNWITHCFCCGVSACQKIIQQRLACSVTCMTPSDSRPVTPGTPSTNSSLSLNHFSGIKQHVAGPSPSPCMNLIVSTTPYGFYTSPSSPNRITHSLPSKVCIIVYQ